MRKKRFVETETVWEREDEYFVIVFEKRGIYRPGESGAKLLVREEKRVLIRRIHIAGGKTPKRVPTQKTMWSTGWSEYTKLIDALLIINKIKEDLENGTYNKSKRYS